VKHKNILFLTGLIILITISGALADIIHLNTGGRIIGKIIDRTEDGIVVSTPKGLIVSIPR